MGLTCGIIGLPNAGKSTLFNCLSQTKAQIAQYPFCTIDPNISVIPVPDERLTKLQNILKPNKIVPAHIEFIDIAGLVENAHQGEGLGNQFLGNILETDAIIHVIRCFDNSEVPHINEKLDPLRDKAIIDTELQLKDMEMVERRLQKYWKKAKAGDKEANKIVSILQEYKTWLGQGKNVRQMEKKEEHQQFVGDLQLLTDKPVLYVCNVDENRFKNSGNQLITQVEEMAEKEGSEVITLAGGIEEEIANLDDEEEKAMFLDELDIEEPVINRLIKASYHLLNLHTFFTIQSSEVKAWTFPEGINAPQAAGLIHTDFEKGFIKAEVIKFADFITYGSEHACREAGKATLHGKQYMVQDGDIIHFRFNV